MMWVITDYHGKFLANCENLLTVGAYCRKHFPDVKLTLGQDELIGMQGNTCVCVVRLYLTYNMGNVHAHT